MPTSRREHVIMIDFRALFHPDTNGVFLLGNRVGVTVLHRWTGQSKAGVHHQLQLLIERGVAEAVLKRPGGSYCQYRLALNGRQN